MSAIRIKLDPDEAHPHPRIFEASRFLVFWRDFAGTIRFVAVPGDDDEWLDLMEGVESGEIGVFEEDEPDPPAGGGNIGADGHEDRSGDGS